MTQAILFFLMTMMPGFLVAQAVDSIGCTGALGEVKYSILAPAEFQGENGPCWAFLNGQNIFQSRLFELTGQLEIPDARGYFIRSYDNSDTNRVDVDRIVGAPVGIIQMDEIGEHSHILQKREDNTNDGDQKDIGDSGHGYFNGRTSTEGGAESRPKNITLYMYIRID